MDYLRCLVVTTLCLTPNHIYLKSYDFILYSLVFAQRQNKTKSIIILYFKYNAPEN